MTSPAVADGRSAAGVPATVSDVVTALETLYPPRWAVEGDAIGLVVGDPEAEVSRILFAVDPVGATVDEAIAKRADLLVVHHPLLFRPVSRVAADSPKGRVVHDLVRSGIALYVAHTNADSPVHGVSESMALAIGLTEIRPLQPDAADPLDKVVTYVPRDDVQSVLSAMAEAGAGSLGEYDRCAFITDGQGTFRPGPAATPTIGTAGEIEVVAEGRLEMVLPRARRADVLAALRHAHPYEEPAFDVVEMSMAATDRGSGRIGRLLEPMTLRGFADAVAAALPETATGVRVSGDLDREVEVVAVVGGAGDFLLDEARASGADAYVTSDLRHHPASEFREHRDAPGLLDVAHWSAEWTWLPVADRAVSTALRARGISVTTEVSHLCTDPWNYRCGGRPELARPGTV